MKTTSSINPPILLKTILDILFIFLIVGLIAYLSLTPSVYFIFGTAISVLKFLILKSQILTITVSISDSSAI